jgi:hypothetical protein
MAVSVASHLTSGWNFRVLLAEMGCCWVLLGAIAFLTRRDFGRQILLGTVEAFALFFTVASVMAWRRPGYFGGPPALPWVGLVIVCVALLTWMELRRLTSSVDVEEARRRRRTRA